MKKIALSIWLLLLSGCEFSQGEFRWVDKDSAPYKADGLFGQNYQKLFRCFMDTAPMPYIDGSKRFWSDRIFSDLGIAEFKVGWFASQGVTLIEFRRVSDEVTRVELSSVYSGGRLMESGRPRSHLGLDYMLFVEKCAKP